MPDTYSKTDRALRRRGGGTRGRCRVARVLVLDQDAEAGRAIQAALLAGGFAADAACEPRAMRAALRARPYDVVVLDHVLAGKSPGYLAGLLLAKQPDAGLVVVTADTSYRYVFGQPGASGYVWRFGYEYLRKPADPALVLAAVRRRVPRPCPFASFMCRLSSACRGLGRRKDLSPTSLGY